MGRWAQQKKRGSVQPDLPPAWLPAPTWLTQWNATWDAGESLYMGSVVDEILPSPAEAVEFEVTPDEGPVFNTFVTPGDAQVIGWDTSAYIDVRTRFVDVSNHAVGEWSNPFRCYRD